MIQKVKALLKENWKIQNLYYLKSVRTGKITRYTTRNIDPQEEPLEGENNDTDQSQTKEILAHTSEDEVIEEYNDLYL